MEISDYFSMKKSKLIEMIEDILAENGFRVYFSEAGFDKIGSFFLKIY